MLLVELLALPNDRRMRAPFGEGKGPKEMTRSHEEETMKATFIERFLVRHQRSGVGVVCGYAKVMRVKAQNGKSKNKDINHFLWPCTLWFLDIASATKCWKRLA